MKRYSLFFTLVLLGSLTGCKKQAGAEKPHNQEKSQENKEAGNNPVHQKIVAAVSNKSYDEAEQLLSSFIMEHPEDDKIAGYKLMLADVHYEREHYQAAHELYTHFGELYPVDPRAEYASFRAAHALFAQRGALACDATETEKTIELCDNYLNHAEYTKFRKQMTDLESTCKRNLLNKEFYVADAYLNQNKLNSAQQRLTYIAQNFDLNDAGGRDRLLFYQAKLAKKCGDSDSLEKYLHDLNADHPQSQFTAMAERLTRRSLF